MKEHKMSRRNFLKVGAVASAAGLMTAAPVAANAAAPAASTAADEENCFGLFQKKPKYIFLFIGDGMGTAQIQSARFYQGTVTNNGAITEAELSFTQFPEVGSVTTYDSTSFCPDSASTATSIASGKKTESGVINMCPWTRDVPYETIAEKLHKQKGYKVGIVSTVNIDHATPAAFYAHQKTRKNYYQIGVELANSGFEYFAGGEFQKVNGDGTDPNNHEVAAQAGYNVVTTQAGAAALKAGAGKTLIIAENLADGTPAACRSCTPSASLPSPKSLPLVTKGEVGAERRRGSARPPFCSVATFSSAFASRVSGDSRNCCTVGSLPACAVLSFSFGLAAGEYFLLTFLFPSRTLGLRRVSAGSFAADYPSIESLGSATSSFFQVKCINEITVRAFYDIKVKVIHAISPRNLRVCVVDRVYKAAPTIRIVLRRLVFMPYLFSIIR